jgi:hypothetical protein
MNRRLAWLMAAVLSTPACSSMSPSPVTGLTGVVMRGPVTPVCRADVPCDQPFSAGFTVQKSGQRIAQFQSDASGRFTVSLAPGPYTVVPNADAPIISPSRQSKTVIVLDNSALTTVQLTFDTGIR